MSASILIKNGKVIDGSGKPAFQADVLIEGEYIQEIGAINATDATEVIDARDLMIAPGFIDAHTHMDFFLPSPRHPEVLKSWIYMGVTTLVCGLCGMSPAPINHERIRDLRVYDNFAFPRDGLKFEWTSFSEFLKYLEKIGQAFNVAMLTGHNTLRNNVMGFEARFATEEEVNEMKNQLQKSLDEGSFGLSLGLGYVPGIFSHTNEIMDIASVLKQYDRPLVTHTRGLSKQYHKAVEEVIHIAETHHIPLQLSHNSSISLGAASKARKIVAAAIERGVRIGNDNIPYASGCSTAFCALPPKLLDGGVDKCFERLQDPEIRKKAIHDIKNVKITWPNWENDFWTDVYLKDNITTKLLKVKLLMHGFKLEKNKKFENLPLKTIAKELKKDYYDTFLDLVIEEKDGLFFSGIINTGKLGDFLMKKTFQDPNCSFITDHVGADFKTDHPVQYGGFTRVIGHFARDKGLFNIEEAVRKMTSLPASQLQLKNRGILKAGYFADITIFNPETIRCVATFKNPHQLSEGIEYVLINGKKVLERNKYDSKACAGKVLRKE